MKVQLVINFLYHRLDIRLQIDLYLAAADIGVVWFSPLQFGMIQYSCVEILAECIPMVTDRMFRQRNDL